MVHTSSNARPAVLSKNDASVLNALFDAESSLSSGVQVDPAQKSSYSIPQDVFSNLQKREAAILRPLSIETPDEAAIKIAVASLTQLIDEHPEYASAYANRAQANRLLLGDAPYTVKDDQETVRSLLDSVTQDLSTAIALASPKKRDDAVSPAQQKLLSSAYTHRAYLYYTIAKSKDLSCMPERFQSLSQERLEDLSSADFRIGGQYGNSVAQEMSVRTNPYAKMCGAIVKEALKKEMGAQPAITTSIFVG